MDNQITKIVNDNQLPQTKAELIVSSFNDFFIEAKQIIDMHGSLTVNKEDDLQGMKQAREARLKLKDIRVQAEKVRKQLKEESRREGLAIDGISNLLKMLIVPTEQHLEQQEKYAELIAEKKRLERINARQEQLARYVDDVAIYNIQDVSDEVFSRLLESCKKDFEARQESKRKEDEARIERERKAKLYHSRKDLLIPYWTFLKGDQISIDFGEISEDEFNIILMEVKEAQQKDKAERMRIAKENEELKKKQEIERQKQEDERKKQQEIIRKATEEKQKAEAQLRAEREEQRKKEEAERQKKFEEEQKKIESERQKALAPDKEKLQQLTISLQAVTMPAVSDRKARMIITQVEDKLNGIIQFISLESQKL